MKRVFHWVLYALSLTALLGMLSACGPKQTTDSPPPTQTQPNDTVPEDTQPQSPNTPNTNETPQTTQSSEQTPPDPNAITFFDCGTLELSNGGEQTGRENFEEFLNITGVGTSATIQITQYTTEGDPIISTLSYDNGAYTLKVDNTADAFAAQDNGGVTETTWKRLVITETTSNDTLYQVFRLTNLDEGAVTGDTPDSADVYTLFREPLTDA